MYNEQIRALLYIFRRYRTFRELTLFPSGGIKNLTHKIALGRPRRTKQTDYGIRYEDVERIPLAQDRVQRWSTVNTVTNAQVS
jgi:hypothetical protein